MQVTVADVSTRSEIRVTIGDTTMAPIPAWKTSFDSFGMPKCDI